MDIAVHPAAVNGAYSPVRAPGPTTTGTSAGAPYDLDLDDGLDVDDGGGPPAAGKARDELLEAAYPRSSSGVALSPFPDVTTTSTTPPNMWSLPYVGLYCQYAAVGLLYGSAGTLLPFCVYVYEGPANVCSNAGSIFLFPWSFKLLFAVITDTYRPWGLRRRPWMVFGWACVLVLLLVLAVAARRMSVSTWLAMQLAVQACVMLSDVPADGYSVEIGRMEPPEQRGQVLATGQRVRFLFSLLAGAIQTFLLNSRATNQAECAQASGGCWAWGLDVQGYYGLLLALVAVLVAPVVWLREPPAAAPSHSLPDFARELWGTLQNQTTLYLIVYAIGIGALTNFPSIVSTYMQYYVIGLTNFQAGIDTVTSYAALVLAVWLFQRYLIRRNWRATHYASSIFAGLLGLLWLLPYHNVGRTRDPWFTIFIDLDQSFVNGLAQVLYSMAVIEVAKPGQEATTYELVITVNNAAISLSGIIATQLLTPMRSVGCTTPPRVADTTTSSSSSSPGPYATACPADQVDITSAAGFDATHGPARFTAYSLLLLAVSIVCCLLFTPFLPKDNDECHRWKADGEARGHSAAIGALAAALALVTVAYGFVAAVLLLDPNTSCLAFVGGTGCH